MSKWKPLSGGVTVAVSALLGWTKTVIVTKSLLIGLKADLWPTLGRHWSQYSSLRSLPSLLRCRSLYPSRSPHCCSVSEALPSLFPLHLPLFLSSFPHIPPCSLGLSSGCFPARLLPPSLTFGSMFIFVSAVFCLLLALPTSVELSAAAPSGCIPPAAVGTCEGEVAPSVLLQCSSSLSPALLPYSHLPHLLCLCFLLPCHFSSAKSLPVSSHLHSPPASFFLACQRRLPWYQTRSINSSTFPSSANARRGLLIECAPPRCALFSLSQSPHLNNTIVCVCRLQLPSSQAQWSPVEGSQNTNDRIWACVRCV